MNALAGSPFLLPHLAVVAIRAADLGRSSGLTDEDATVLYVAGLVHDVGKVPALASTGFHPLDGARLAEARGAREVAVLVAQHTGARYEAHMHGIELPFPWQPSELHDALMLADLTTGPGGHVMTLNDRRADVEARYASDSVEVRALHDLWPEVLAAAERFRLK